LINCVSCCEFNEDAIDTKHSELCSNENLCEASQYCPCDYVEDIGGFCQLCPQTKWQDMGLPEKGAADCTKICEDAGTHVLNIYGYETCDSLGHSVALSSDGNTLAIGADDWNEVSRLVCVFKWNNYVLRWNVKDIKGKKSWDRLGTSVSLSGN
jgi:hypothetical protein